MNIPREVEKFGIISDPMRDQFFLTDKTLLGRIVDYADTNKNDIVLEIGAGFGNLTSEIAKYAGRVISFEIDERFKPILEKLPKNVEMYYENAWDYVQLHGKYKKKNKKIDLIRWGARHNFPFNLTRTCTSDSAISCGQCSECQERIETFKLAKVKDLINYKI